jgi:hypothetical protein
MRALLIVAAFIALPTVAQTPPTPPAPPAAPGAPAGNDMRARLLAADTNKDGKWSLEEWLAAGRREQGFRFLDANADGLVTPEELRIGMTKMREMRMGETPVAPQPPQGR